MINITLVLYKSNLRNIVTSNYIAIISIIIAIKTLGTDLDIK